MSASEYEAHDAQKFEKPTFFAPQGAPAAELVTWAHLLSCREGGFFICLFKP
jgi:hypothetical protein